MEEKIRVGLLCGGRSAEHEISLLSAQNVFNALDKKRYDVTLIGIDKQGLWFLQGDTKKVFSTSDPKQIGLDPKGNKVTLFPNGKGADIVALDQKSPIKKLDVIFPMLHGPYGEDGTMQGLIKSLDVPFVGTDVLGSSVCMDKDVTKRLLLAAGLPTAKFRAFYRTHKDTIEFNSIEKEIGLPCFIKPANMGSSVGISKVYDRAQFDAAIDDAFQYDHKILIEEFIKGREFECSVLGNGHPEASLPGELIPQTDFYSYDAKYVDEDGVILEMPAKLPEKIIKKMQTLAIAAFQTTCCDSMARVDFLMNENGKPFINEINTIPGFTNISMYPKLWEVSGLSQPALMDRLIQLAFERYERDHTLKVDK